jgi:tetratricopeptide (TPR) repeat protein
LALLYASRDLEVSIALVEGAIAVNPNLGYAWYTSGIIRVSNSEPDSAIAHIEHAMRLRPIDPLISSMWRTIAIAHLLAGRHDQALSASEQGLRNQWESASLFLTLRGLVLLR